jgi:6-phosphogluconolactonase
MEETGGFKLNFFKDRKNERKIRIFPELSSLIEEILILWKRIAEESIRKRGRFSVALSGGNSPVPLYEALGKCQKALPWDKTHIFQVDERMVPESHKDSNFGMIRKMILKPAGIPQKQIHPIPILKNSKMAASNYENELRDFFNIRRNRFPRFDLMLLGLGKDGHIASLFPDSEHLSEKVKWSVPARSENYPHDRVSLTLPVINRSRMILFFVTGESKAEVIRQIVFEEASFPAVKVHPQKGKLLFYLDEEAGRLL